MGLSPDNTTSIVYHNIFDYPLTVQELHIWKSSKSVTGITNITYKNGFYFLKGREEIVKKRLRREKYSKKKLKIAKHNTCYLSLVPSVLFVGITGALAMNNASKNSDIDLFIITKKNSLWLTRLAILVILVIRGIPFRRAGRREERDKLCLNMWLDEGNLSWPKNDRNIYTSHEIAQIKPLINKNRIYEKFLFKNKWVLDFWPKAVQIRSMQYVASSRQKFILHSTFYMLRSVVEKLAFKLQYLYMKSKITREVVTPTCAIFHPNDWGKRVLKKLNLI